MPTTSQRTARFTESVIREMTRVALESDAINLAQGFPDSDPPPALIEAAKAAMDAHRHQYAITWGSPELRAALAAKNRPFQRAAGGCRARVGRHLRATEAMMVAMLTLCDPATGWDCSRRSTRTTTRMRSSPERCSPCGAASPALLLRSRRIAGGLPKRSEGLRALQSVKSDRTGLHRGPNCGKSQASRRSMIRSSSRRKSTNISCSRR